MLLLLWRVEGKLCKGFLLQGDRVTAALCLCRDGEDLRGLAQLQALHCRALTWGRRTRPQLWLCHSDLRSRASHGTPLGLAPHL